MSMRNSSYIIYVMLGLCGCSSARMAQDYQRDSVSVVIRDSIAYRDSIVYVDVEKDNSNAILPDTDTSYLSTRYAESEAFVKEGKLHHTLRNRNEAIVPVQIKVPVKFRMESFSDISRHKEIVEVEKQLSRWQRFIMALGYGLLGAIAVWIARTLAKYLK